MVLGCNCQDKMQVRPATSKKQWHVMSSYVQWYVMYKLLILFT